MTCNKNLFPSGLNLIPDGFETPIVVELLIAIPAFLLSEIVVRSYGVESVYSSNLAPMPFVDD